MRLDIDRRMRGRMMVAATLLSIFMAGSLTGAAVMHARVGRGAADESATRVVDPACVGSVRRPGPLVMSEMLTRILTDRLGLTAEQQARIAEIVRDQQPRAQAMLKELRPKLMTHVAATRTAIRNVLTPAQREAFDRFEAERREAILGEMRRRTTDTADPHRPPNATQGRRSLIGHCRTSAAQRPGVVRTGGRPSNDRR